VTLPLALAALVLSSLTLNACGFDSSLLSDDKAPPDLPARGAGQLSALTIANAHLTPDFSPEVTEYALKVGYFTDTLYITPTSSDAQTSIEINGTKTTPELLSPGLTLAPGTTVFKIVARSTTGESRTYTLTVSRTVDVTYVKPSFAGGSPGDTQDYFGSQVAMFESSIAVGVKGDDSNAAGINGKITDYNSIPSSGAAYVYTRKGTGWDNQAYIKADMPTAFSQFGFSVALHKDTLVVGAPTENTGASASGAAYVFVRRNNVWTQQATLKASNAEANDQFGYQVAVYEDNLAVSAIYEDGGTSGVDGDQSSNTLPESGAVYVFKRIDGIWLQQAYIKASNADASDLFGLSLALHKNTLVVGSPKEDGSAKLANGVQNNDSLNSGAVYVFDRSTTGWTQQAYLKASNTDENDRFGMSVALDENVLAVGAPLESSSSTGVGGDQVDNFLTNSGAVYLYTRKGSTWSAPTYFKASNTGAADSFGWSVALHGNLLTVGAPSEASNAKLIDGEQRNDNFNGAGAMYVFSRKQTKWSQIAYVKASNSDAADQFGQTVALWDGTVVVGAQFEQSNATTPNGNQSDNSAPGAGACYIYE